MIIGIFTLIAILFFILGYRTSHSQKPVSLWANETNEIRVTDIRQYNHQCARLLVGYGIMLIIAGLMTQFNQIFLTICAMLMIVFSSLLLMILYTQIEGKYRL